MTKASEASAGARRIELGRALIGARGRRSPRSLAERLGVAVPVFEGWKAGTVDLTFELAWAIERELCLRPGTLGLKRGYALGSDLEMGRAAITEHLVSSLANARDVVSAALLLGLTVQARPLGEIEPPESWVIRLGY